MPALLSPVCAKETTMSKKAAIITVHGMGKTERDYNEEIVRELRRRLGAMSDDLHIGTVYYQDILKPNEERVWNLVAARVRWDRLRKFLLFGFADAAGLESDKDSRNSDYRKAQLVIARELFVAREAMGGDGPVVILAHSLGGHVTSCYFWDAGVAAQGRHPGSGIWRNITDVQTEITGGRDLTTDEIGFLQGNSFRTFITTGCNIPIFVAAHAKSDILPIRPNGDFEWHNYYDKDDVLGWPLADLYGNVVVDHAVNASSGILGWLLKSWNPLSHTQYWGDDEVLGPLVEKLRQLLS
jgi:hypothetical protein